VLQTSPRNPIRLPPSRSDSKQADAALRRQASPIEPPAASPPQEPAAPKAQSDGEQADLAFKRLGK
jgi:hypothetical protein